AVSIPVNIRLLVPAAPLPKYRNRWHWRKQFAYVLKIPDVLLRIPSRLRIPSHQFSNAQTHPCNVLESRAEPHPFPDETGSLPCLSPRQYTSLPLTDYNKSNTWSPANPGSFFRQPTTNPRSNLSDSHLQDFLPAIRLHAFSLLKTPYSRALTVASLPRCGDRRTL